MSLKARSTSLHAYVQASWVQLENSLVIIVVHLPSKGRCQADFVISESVFYSQHAAKVLYHSSAKNSRLVVKVEKQFMASWDLVVI